MRPDEALGAINHEYNLHPNGWRIYAGADGAGCTTLYVFHNGGAWTIKYSRFGMNGVAGKVKIEEDDLVQEIAEDPMAYGLRMMTAHMFEILLRQGREEELKPVAESTVRETAPEDILSGPVLVHNISSPIGPISASQGPLEERLQQELGRLAEGMYF